MKLIINSKEMNTGNKNIFFVLLVIFLTQNCVKPQKPISTITSASTTQTNNPETDYKPTVPDSIYAEHVRTTEFQTPEQEKASFILPPGFEATLFASEPDITKPINMAFDERGRLWVTQSSEYPIEAGPSKGIDRITILEDTDGDGRADKINDFANDLNIPIGIMPVKDGAIAFSIPNVYRFTDTNKDGKADSRKVLLGPFGHKDTHGMINNLIRGFDGWIHASHGFSNTSVVAGTDGDSIKMFSGNTFRFTQDGNRAEKTTDGRINPFGSAYDEMGYHYSADCHTLPIYQLIWGGDYTQWGKKDRSMGFAPTMMDYDLNSTALAGLVYYTDTHFPAEYQNSFYSGDVVTCRISRNTMSFTGSTPKASRKADFLVSKDPWFRPVDLKVGPDGALYVADFYNRIIGHYEVPLNHPGRDRISGRIWKITYKGNPLHPVKDWSKASQEELLTSLSDAVLQTRMKATDELVDRLGKEAIPALQKLVKRKTTDPRAYVQALWALYRLNELSNDVLIAATNHSDVRVQLHAFKVMANFKTLPEELKNVALQGIAHQNPHVQRAATEVLGRHPDQRNYTRLVTLANKVPDSDTHLSYTILLSIKNHLAQPAIMQQVVTQKWNSADAGILALVAADVHSPEAGSFLLHYLKNYDAPTERWPIYIESITSNIPQTDLQQVIDLARNRTANNPQAQFHLAKAVNMGLEQRGMKATTTMEKWNTELATHFLKNIPTGAESWSKEMKGQQQYAAQMAGLYKVQSLEPQLQQMLASPLADEESRVAAADALMSISPERHITSIATLITNGDETPSLRRKLVNSLGQSKSVQVKLALGKALKNAPYEVQESIARILAGDLEGKSELIKLIRQGDAPARLLKSREVEERFLAGLEPQQRQAFTELTTGIQPISEERQKLIDKRMKEFDPKGKTAVMGKAVFVKNCSMCHQIDKKGGLIGPQLDGIGNWGRASLTTKILDPNRNITENFRMYNITLKDGKMVSGLYRRDEGQLLVLANPSGEEFTVAQQNIQEKTPSPYTLMPDHFHSTIPKEDFDALLVFLLQEK